MKNLNINNPFNAPVFFEEIVSSTMDVSRKLTQEGNRHGTVIMADFQEAGRGRMLNRKWEMDKGMNLAFTALFRFKNIEEIPAALTLRTGLAVSLAIEDFAPSLKGDVKVKWPNDIMIGSKKTVGILCEADGGNVHIGIGVNVSQMNFPLHLKEKATSIKLASGLKTISETAFMDRNLLLEKILLFLFNELETPAGNNWKYRLEERLYKKDENILFIDGIANSGNEIKGQLCGIGENGELLVLPNGEKEIRSFVTGELVIY